MCKIIEELAFFDLRESKKKISELPINGKVVVWQNNIDANPKPMGYIVRKDAKSWHLIYIIYNDDGKAYTNDFYSKLAKEMDFLGNYKVDKVFQQITATYNGDCEYKKVWIHLLEILSYYIECSNSLMKRKLNKYIRLQIEDIMPIYKRAKSYVMLEMTNYSDEVEKNKCNIVALSGRVKSIESIEEKVYRKNICCCEIFKKFDDFAGVRVVCEYVSDVYNLLKYIEDNTLIKVLNVDDKIENPTVEGYRGIHVIVAVDVYYQGKTYHDIRVELQLRTSLENAWAMKTHDLTYKRTSEISKDVAKQMKELSDYLNSADLKAQELRDFMLNVEEKSNS